MDALGSQIAGAEKGGDSTSPAESKDGHGPDDTFANHHDITS